MEIRILGPTEVLEDGRPLPLPTGRGRSLLALLVLSAGEVVSTDRLVDELWGEAPPPTVDTALQGLVSKLRKRLEPMRPAGQPPSILVTRPPGYLLAIDPGQVDATGFRHLVAEAETLPAREAGALLRRALALWRGPALADFAYEPFAQAEITSLEELRLNALEKRIQADLALGRQDELIGELQGLVLEHPLRERLREQLMLALYRSGRQAEALQVYADARRTLLDELGLDPGPSLQRTEGLILRQDASLDLRPAPTSASAGDGAGWITEERKTVTVLSLDVVISTSRGGAPDAEAGRRAVERFSRRAAAVVTGHGGSAEQQIGDSLVGFFGVPSGREDDALRAVRAAVDLRHLLAAVNEELRRSGDIGLTARIGVDTGEVVVGGAAADVSGSAVQGAARLRQLAGEGEILVGETTRLLVGRAAILEAEDRAAWKVLDLAPGPPVVSLVAEAPIMGRERELARLRAAYDQVAQEGMPFRLTVLGEAGIGKSRLARELASLIVAEARVLTGHCPAYGQGITFWPLREMVLGAAGRVTPDALLDLLRDEDDAAAVAERVLAAIASAEPLASPEAVFPTLRRFFEAIARPRPAVLIVEDLHWAEATFLDLVEYLTAYARAPLLLLCLARPDLVERRPDWGEGARAGLLVLGPLGAEGSRKLAVDRLAGRIVSADVVERVLETAQGNPLFVEQMLAAIGDEGDFVVPATIQALLAARIDRLGPAERDLTRAASILGRRFPVAVLMGLLPEPARRQAARHLRALERKELMLAATELPSGAELSFSHVLVQQAAYRSMTKQTRADLHERAADRLERGALDEGTGLAETVGHHLERAYRYRRELGDLDAHTQHLAIRAGERLADAGLRAFGRFDAAGAETLLARARELLPTDHPERREVSYRLAEAHETMGGHGDADAVLAELLDRTPADADTRQVLQLERARISLAIGPDPVPLEQIGAQAATALALHEARGNHAGAAQALFVQAEIRLRRGRIAEMEAVARRALVHADRSGSAREQLGARRMLATALEVGPASVPRAIDECERLGWHGMENPAVLPVLALLRAMAGEFDDGRELIGRAELLLRERTRARRPLILLRRRSAQVEALAGDLQAAERDLREALRLAAEMETREEASEVAALLARVLVLRGASDEAAEMADLARTQAPSESVTPQALWRSTLAVALAARGETHEAVDLTHSARDLVPPAMPNLRADVHLDLARTLLATGRAREARDAIDRATDLYSQKGNLAAASGARLLAAGGP